MPELLIHGTDGKIEIRYQPAMGDNVPIAVVMHPHPEHGGNMNSKIVNRTAKAFQNCGFATVCFNFRGVGRSTGEYNGGIGEIADAATALDWLQNQHPSTNQIWVAGFSFGAWIATQLMIRRPEISNFIAIGSPTNMFDFSLLSPCPTSGLFIHATEDEIAPIEDFKSFISKLTKINNIKVKKEYIDKADHFFTNKLDELEESITKYIRENIK